MRRELDEVAFVTRNQRDRLQVRDGSVELVVADKPVDRAAPRDLVQLYDVEMPSDDPDLARFYLVELRHARWIVPYFTPGSATGIGALCAGRSASAELYRATLDVLPWAWRWRLLGIPIAPLPRLVRCEPGPLPQWTRREGPLDALSPECAARSPE